VTITLLGGWAVYSYNPYLGSFDIDCLGPRDPFTLHLNLYMKTHGYVLEPESPVAATSESWRKYVYEGTTMIGYIEIDACDFEFRNSFKEDPSKEVPYTLCLDEKFVINRLIDGEYFWVPIKELLFLYKIKSTRDRQYVLTHEDLTSEQLGYLVGKVSKDLSDLVALLDPREEAMDGYILGNLIREYNLSFVTGTISNLPSQPGAAGYSKGQADITDIRRWTEKILSDLQGERKTL